MIDYHHLVATTQRVESAAQAQAVIKGMDESGDFGHRVYLDAEW
jgi:hypothetical protein